MRRLLCVCIKWDNVSAWPLQYDQLETKINWKDTHNPTKANYIVGEIEKDGTVRRNEELWEMRKEERRNECKMKVAINERINAWKYLLGSNDFHFILILIKGIGHTFHFCFVFILHQSVLYPRVWQINHQIYTKNRVTNQPLVLLFSWYQGKKI